MCGLCITGGATLIYLILLLQLLLLFLLHITVIIPIASTNIIDVHASLISDYDNDLTPKEAFKYFNVIGLRNGAFVPHLIAFTVEISMQAFDYEYKYIDSKRDLYICISSTSIVSNNNNNNNNNINSNNCLFVEKTIINYNLDNSDASYLHSKNATNGYAAGQMSWMSTSMPSVLKISLFQRVIRHNPLTSSFPSSTSSSTASSIAASRDEDEKEETFELIEEAKVLYELVPSNVNSYGLTNACISHYLSDNCNKTQAIVEHKYPKLSALNPLLSLSLLYFGPSLSVNHHSSWLLSSRFSELHIITDYKSSEYDQYAHSKFCNSSYSRIRCCNIDNYFTTNSNDANFLHVFNKERSCPFVTSKIGYYDLVVASVESSEDFLRSFRFIRQIANHVTLIFFKDNHLLENFYAYFLDLLVNKTTCSSKGDKTVHGDDDKREKWKNKDSATIIMRSRFEELINKYAIDSQQGYTDNALIFDMFDINSAIAAYRHDVCRSYDKSIDNTQHHHHQEKEKELAQRRIEATKSSKAHFHFAYGTNTAVLENACVASSNDIILFSRAEQGGSSRPILSKDLRDHLAKSSSGFRGKDNLFNFIEVSNEIFDLVPQLASRFIDNSALISSPPYTHSIFHAAQILMQIIRVTNLIKLKLSVTSLFERDVLLPALLDVKSLIFTTISITDYEWTMSFIQVVKSYLELELNLNKKCKVNIDDINDIDNIDNIDHDNHYSRSFDFSQDDSDAESCIVRRSLGRITLLLKEELDLRLSKSFSSTTSGRSSSSSNMDSNYNNSQHRDDISDYNHSKILNYTFIRQHVTSGDPDNIDFGLIWPVHNWICHSRLIVLGALELSLPFVHSAEAADHFREFVYAYIDKPSLITNPFQTIINNNNSSSNSNNNNNNFIINSNNMKQKHPNSKIRVTLFMRPENRWILNLQDVFRTLDSTGLVDMDWMAEHVVHIEVMPFAAQVRLMRETDLLISPHGAGLTNLMFMQKGSAVIELMTAPWYEIGYQPSALVFGIHYNVLAQTDFSKSYSCMIMKDCLDTSLLVDRKKLTCYGIRQCSAIVDTGALEIAVWQASQNIRILKRGMFSEDSYSTCNFCSSNDNSSDSESNTKGSDSEKWKDCNYKKAYEVKLD